MKPISCGISPPPWDVHESADPCIYEDLTQGSELCILRF